MNVPASYSYLYTMQLHKIVTCTPFLCEQFMKK